MHTFVKTAGWRTDLKHGAVGQWRKEISSARPAMLRALLVTAMWSDRKDGMSSGGMCAQYMYAI